MDDAQDIGQKSVNCITVNTDASFSQKYKVGGYAFYIVCDIFKIQKSGMFKVHPKSPIEAEMMCMANALHALLSQKELPVTKWIVINSDCICSFEKIKRKSTNVIGRTVANLLRKVRQKTSSRHAIMPKYQFRHVKAHNGSPDARSYVNEWCDKEAKKWMRKAVESVKEELSIQEK
jgi:ribonuclease HI